MKREEEFTNPDGISYDPQTLREVKAGLEEGRFFERPERFALKKGPKFKTFRKLIEGDLERFLWSQREQAEELRARLHRPEGVEGAVNEALEAVGLLYSFTLLSGDEATRLSARIETELRPELLRIRQEAAAMLPGGRPTKRYKAICIGFLRDHFKRYTNLKEEEIFREIAGLFLVCRLADTACAGYESTGPGVKPGVYLPVLQGGEWKIDARPGKRQRVKQCEFFIPDGGTWETRHGSVGCEELSNGNEQGRCGCVRTSRTLVRELKRWRAEEREQEKKERTDLVEKLRAEGWTVTVSKDGMINVSGKRIATFVEALRVLRVSKGGRRALLCENLKGKKKAST